LLTTSRVQVAAQDLQQLGVHVDNAAASALSSVNWVLRAADGGVESQNPERACMYKVTPAMLAVSDCSAG